MMKIIHTSDWHIGQTLHQYQRDDEHRFFFNQLKNIILEVKPDALIVSGDIFHSATPTVVSQRIYYHALVELSQLLDDFQIIVTAGNHDSPSRIEAPRELWEAFNVTVVGNLDFYRDAAENQLSYDVSKIKIPIKNNNEIVGWVLAVPFLNASNYPSLSENDSYSNRVFHFYKELKDDLKKDSQYKENHSVVAMGHFMMSTVNTNAYNKMIGGLESVDSDGMMSLKEIDYWALGHVHHPQHVGENIRYSGSPFALTFNEDYNHSVSIVTIEDHNVDVEIREIEPLIPIVDFPFKPKSYENAISVDDVLAKITDIIDNKCYVRLHAKSNMPLSDVTNAKILELFEGKNAKYCGVQVYLPVQNTETTNGRIRTLDEFKAISPFELGCSVYLKKNNAEMTDEMKCMFKKVCDDVMSL